ncbi:hypothetical protein CIHG_03211 [Coccidioides immitis H538.4]|uniref:Uncharacterized protein n=3 Tax=Coccidioides immitis TaxID=5501 RepID=A0A0J8QT05_COCIT|nr:hypothetical protein CIRG_00905 [Coccidioides immitis RMSCC 2394]KMU75576.1 hypothetical protein CISG_04979 [Coccidioides immitis RMSCC 3703]KMU85429.1 hypothetical protein CIHG_03211 [Coccidioides immitis H538.4]
MMGKKGDDIELRAAGLRMISRNRPPNSEIRRSVWLSKTRLRLRKSKKGPGAAGGTFMTPTWHISSPPQHPNTPYATDNRLQMRFLRNVRNPPSYRPRAHFWDQIKFSAAGFRDSTLAAIIRVSMATKKCLSVKSPPSRQSQ